MGAGPHGGTGANGGDTNGTRSGSMSGASSDHSQGSHYNGGRGGSGSSNNNTTRNINQKPSSTMDALSAVFGGVVDNVSDAVKSGVQTVSNVVNPAPKPMTIRDYQQAPDTQSFVGRSNMGMATGAGDHSNVGNAWASDYGVVHDDSVLQNQALSEDASLRADQAWARGDYGGWAQSTMDSLGHSLSSSVGKAYDNVLHAPLDYAADIARSPLGLAALAFTGPIGLTVGLAVESIDNLVDVVQGEVGVQDAIGQQLKDTGGFVGGIPGAGLAAAGYGLQGDGARAAGTLTGGILSAGFGPLGGIAGRGVESAINHAGPAVGASIAGHLNGGGGGHLPPPPPPSPISSDASNPAGIGDVAQQAQDNLHRQGGLGITAPGTTSMNDNLGALSGANTQPMQFGQNAQALTQAQIDQQRTGIRAGGTVNGDTGIALGGGSGSTGIQTANTTVANDATTHGYAINNNPDLVDTSGYTYINQNGILNV